MFGNVAKNALQCLFSRLVAGIIGALYVWVHRRYVLWFRANKRLKSFLEKKYDMILCKYPDCIY